ncbi:very long chain fatty acid elongase 5-like [Anticarsia gemmatalis]|uniref:very long chain fatty acid elongase 5-like n=1 Tax=Anticarsia gemmatalis TaxID=129554 RepID=UPI003F75946B
MSVIIGGAVKLYYYLNDEIKDHRSQDWPLMRTPWPGLAIVCVYLLTVTKWLPDYMKNRPAFELRTPMAIYNAAQILGCIFIFYKSLTLGWLSHYSFVCQAPDEGPNSVEYAWYVCYGYFVMKLVDLLDTIFFVLRKKQNQVSFLHVYHHFGMVAVAWSIVKWVPGGHCTLLITLNCAVHTVMYTYYLLTAWDESYKQSIWWKKYVTQMQILQFSILLIHFIGLVMTPVCAFPRPPAYILLPQNVFMLLLFSDFYYRTYIKSKKHMSVIIGGAVRLYTYLNDEIHDRRTEDWFLMRTPWPGLAILGVYLMAVLRWLPDYMKNRPAYDLRTVITVYNAAQILGCMFIFYKSLTLGWLSHYSLVCQPIDEGPYGVEFAWYVCYGYFTMKLVDLLDTIFFILRKKYNQVTFLHVYHHAGMVALAWGYVKWAPGGHCTLLMTINCLVHAVMYSYYQLTVWDNTIRQSIWWKKYITLMQMVQFTIMVVHFSLLLTTEDCPYPRPPAFILIPQHLFMLIMFMDFYYRSYIKTKSKKQ